MIYVNLSTLSMQCRVHAAKISWLHDSKAAEQVTVTAPLYLCRLGREQDRQNMTLQMRPHHWVISLATRLGVCQTNVSSNRMLKPQQTKTLIPVIIWLLSNLPLSAAWKEIGLGFKTLLSRNKLTRGAYLNASRRGVSEVFDMLGKKRDVWGR